jgi:hypothetical protein
LGKVRTASLEEEEEVDDCTEEEFASTILGQDNSVVIFTRNLSKFSIGIEEKAIYI